MDVQYIRMGEVPPRAFFSIQRTEGILRAACGLSDASVRVNCNMHPCFKLVDRSCVEVYSGLAAIASPAHSTPRWLRRSLAVGVASDGDER